MVTTVKDKGVGMFANSQGSTGFARTLSSPAIAGSSRFLGVASRVARGSIQIDTKE